MTKMKNTSVVMLCSLALLSAFVPTTASQAENVKQKIELVKVDVQKLSTGYRTSKIMGTAVVNDENETIGKVDDLIVSPDDNKSAYVIVSVGGWLGMGNYLVAFPYSNLHINNSRILLPGATKEGLKNLPEFKYSTN